MTIEQIKREYENGSQTFDTAVEELVKLGMTEEGAEYLVGGWDAYGD